MYEPESDSASWGLFNLDQIFNNNYYGDHTQHDMKISREWYASDSHSDTECDNIDNDQSIARALLQEELSQLSIVEAPELSCSGEDYLQDSNVVPNWQSPSSNYNPGCCFFDPCPIYDNPHSDTFLIEYAVYAGQDGYLGETDDVGSLCSSPGDRSCDGEDYSCTLEITDESELDGEVEKRLYQMIPVPHIPRINGDIPSVDEATSDHQRLLDRLQLYELVEHKVQGDGNCQFRALSDQIYRTPEHHTFVRQQVVHQLKAHPEMYEGYVPMEYGEYLKRMPKSGEWGDHVTLQAAADSYGVKILVITSFKDTCYIEILPKDQKSKRVIYLSFWAEVHYNSIYPQGDLPPRDFKKKKWWDFRNKH